MADILERVVNVICKADVAYRDPKGDEHHPLTLEDIQEAMGIIKSYEKEVADMQLQRELLMVTEPMNEAAMTEAARRTLMKRMRKRPSPCTSSTTEEEKKEIVDALSCTSSSSRGMKPPDQAREKKRMRKRPPHCTSSTTEESARSPSVQSVSCFEIQERLVAHPGYKASGLRITYNYCASKGYLHIGGPNFATMILQKKMGWFNHFKLITKPYLPPHNNKELLNAVTWIRNRVEEMGCLIEEN